MAGASFRLAFGPAPACLKFAVKTTGDSMEDKNDRG